MFVLGKCWWCEPLPSACEGCADSTLRNERKGQEFLVMLKGNCRIFSFRSWSKSLACRVFFCQI